MISDLDVCDSSGLMASVHYIRRWLILINVIASSNLVPLNRMILILQVLFPLLCGTGTKSSLCPQIAWYLRVLGHRQEQFWFQTYICFLPKFLRLSWFLNILWWRDHIIIPHTMKLVREVYCLHSIRLSVCSSAHPSIPHAYNSGWILFILGTNDH